MSTPQPRQAFRRDNWEACFALAVERARKKTFALGSFDCCLLAADLILSITGVDMAAEFRAQYGTTKEALAILNERGGLVPFVESLCREHGMTPRSPSYAQRGDLLFVRTQDEGWPLVVGIASGSVAIVPAQGCGVTFVPVSQWVACWHIEHHA